MAASDLDRQVELARRYLHWAVFLLAVMFGIMLIDLQLKKSVARQAADAARLLSEVRYGGSPVAAARGDGPGGVPGDVGGDAGVAAGAPGHGGQDADAAAAGLAGPAGGTPGDDA